MSGVLANTTWVPNTTYPDFVYIGLFRFPFNPDENYKLIDDSQGIAHVVSLLVNLVLLGIIIKNPGSKKRTASSILLISLCILNLIVSTIGVVHFTDSSLRPDSTRLITNKMIAFLMSIMLPKYYSNTFLLALINYGLIVKPLRFKTLAPEKPRTMVLIILLLWLVSSVAFAIPPLLVEDFENYAETAVTVLVSLCWFITLVIVVIYVKILVALRRRELSLERQFNASSSNQGKLVLKQNKKLAKVLYLFITLMVLFTLPLYTSYLVLLYCFRCRQRAFVKFSLYLTPVFMALPLFFPLHWLFGTPQYYKEFKRLIRRVLVFCRLVDKD